MGAHNHLRDAASALESGNTEGAQRHLRAAASLFTPQNLTRFGHLHDDTHMAGKQHMHSAHRLILQVKDAEDTKAREEQQAQARRVMNAPAHQGLGRPDGTAEGPSAPIGQAPYKRLPARSWIAEGAESAGPKLLSNTDLAGPKGYEHGWHFVGTNTPHAAGYHGMQVAGQTKTGKVFGTYDHPKREVVTPEGYRRHVTHIASMKQGSGETQAPLRSVMLSAQTARLAATPAPRGKPGGPGLYDVSGMGHTDYLQQIVKALIEKRGMDPSRAYAIARGAIRKWAAGGGKVHPEVRAAAGAAEAGELARQARAKAVHGHSNPMDLAGKPYYVHPGEDVECPYCHKMNEDDAKFCDQCGRELPASAFHNVELAGWESELRGKIGQWVSGPGQALESGPKISDIKMKPHEMQIYNHFRSQGLNHFQAMAMVENHRSIGGIGLANPNHAANGQFTTPQNAQQNQKSKKPGIGKHDSMAQRARAKGQLLTQANKDSQKAAGLRNQLRALAASLRSSHSSHGKSGATKAAGGASKAPTSKSSTAPSKSSTSGASSKSRSSSRAQVQAKMTQLRTQIQALDAQARQLRAQAARL
jgi:hypothetical protein